MIRVASSIVRTSTPPRLVLASASPARLRTLNSAGIVADVIVSGVDEDSVEASRPEALCATLARMKALAVAERIREQGAAPATGNTTDGATGDDTGDTGDTPGDQTGEETDDQAGAQAGTLVLGCDSVLSFNGEILGKPADAAEATKRWQQMRGRSGVLYTGHCLVAVGRVPGADRLAEATGATTVRFADLTDEEIAAYVATGEPVRVAGAFTIDGVGGPFIEGIEGDHGTVIGLSLPLLRHLLAELGLAVHDLWARPAER